MYSEHAVQVAHGNRFKFGANWLHFLRLLSSSRIERAENSLCVMLGVTDLIGKTFLDIGSGSGLFSLAAKKLGATVHSFDYDPASVACTRELKARYFHDDKNWTIEEGSVLSRDYLEKLGQFDIVYSWGVLHHTGNMIGAFSNVAPLVSKGYLFIAIYNDQGWVSRYWLNVKKIYNKGPLGQVLMVVLHFPYLYIFRSLIKMFQGRPLERGMSLWYDMLDWLGGYPFEVAKPEVVIHFFQSRGYELKELKTCGGRLGCNEFIFYRNN